VGNYFGDDRVGSGADPNAIKSEVCNARGDDRDEEEGE
jgi:hypothetical protein